MNIVDLFSGCGGFSLGAHEAGLGSNLAFDVDPILTSSFAQNFPKTKLILKDISGVTGAAIRRELDGRVDGIFGGPPCQAFSAIGYRNADDPRRTLVSHFFRIVAQTRPAFFVMENVRGLMYADALPVLDAGINLLPGFYNILGPIVLDAADYGAATRRPRLFVIGYDPKRCDKLTEVDLIAAQKDQSNVRSAIGDLMTAKYWGEDAGYDVWKICSRGRPSHYSTVLRAPGNLFTGHRRTVHTPEVTKRFKRVEPGGIDPVGRHPRLDWAGLCPNLRAGTGNDRGSYQSVRPLHPDEPRVVTVREAARLQGFPDSFRFHPTVWHSFRMIGNSVSPFVAKAIFAELAMRTGLGLQPIAAE